MKFGEKLRCQRARMGYTQEQLSEMLGLSKRTVEGYEAGQFYPKKREVYDRLSGIFGVERNYFLTEDEDALPDAATEAERVLKQVKALYAGGSLSPRDEDELASALMHAYFIARRRREGGRK